MAENGQAKPLVKENRSTQHAHDTVQGTRVTRLGLRSDRALTRSYFALIAPGREIWDRLLLYTRLFGVS